MQPSPCKNKQRIPQIHRVNIERCILGSARSSPSQINLCLGKRNGAQEGRGLPLLRSCLSSVHYTVAGNQPEIWTNAPFTFGAELQPAHKDPSPMSTRTSATFSEYDLISERKLGLDFPNLQRKQLPRATSHCLSCPLSATFTLFLANTVLSTCLEHQNDPLRTLSPLNMSK